MSQCEVFFVLPPLTFPGTFPLYTLIQVQTFLFPKCFFFSIKNRGKNALPENDVRTGNLFRLSMMTKSPRLCSGRNINGRDEHREISRTARVERDLEKHERRMSNKVVTYMT